jgi:hypothetical protein
MQLSERLERIDTHYGLQREAVEREAARQRAALARRHEAERERFLKYWERPTILLKFSKPSPALLDMREVQRRMTIVMDFAGAEYMKQQADALEMREAQEANDRAARTMKTAASHLRRRQERESQIVEALIEQRFADVEAEKMKMKTPVERTLKHVSDPNAPLSADASVQTARYRSALVSRSGTRDPIPRTFRKEAVKRKDPQVQQLPVKPLHGDGLFENSEPASARRRYARSS